MPAARVKVRRWDAILFDVDGTLYHARILRAHVAIALAATLLRSPRVGPHYCGDSGRTGIPWRCLRGQPLFPGTFGTPSSRRRTTNRVAFPKVSAPLSIAGSRRCLPRTETARRMHLVSCLPCPGTSGSGWGWCPITNPEKSWKRWTSPAFFDVIVHADDPEVEALKPSPRGIQVALQRLKWMHPVPQTSETGWTSMSRPQSGPGVTPFSSGGPDSRGHFRSVASMPCPALSAVGQIERTETPAAGTGTQSDRKSFKASCLGINDQTEGSAPVAQAALPSP